MDDNIHMNVYVQAGRKVAEGVGMLLFGVGTAASSQFEQAVGGIITAASVAYWVYSMKKQKKIARR